MTRYGHSASGAQRWRCSLCNISQVSRINSTAKHLDEFLAWLLGRRRQADLPGGGRSFRRRCQQLWQLWPFNPIVDEVHDVIFVDGIHLDRGAVVLIAQTPDHVLGWYAARSENSRAWEALMSRIAPPALVVTDGGSGFAKACKRIWPTTRVQRCTFHTYCRIRQATTTRPKLEASQGLYVLGQQLLHVEDPEDAQEWIGAYQGWCTRWKDFLEEKTRRPDGGWEYTHDRLVRARNSLNKLIRQGLLFTYLDPTWDHPMPATTNQIERHERAPTPDAARPLRHAPDPTHESRVLVVLHPLCTPPASSNNPGHHAHRRSPRKCLVPRLSNPSSHRHHPRLGRRNMLERTPPHHPLPQPLGLTPQPTRFVL